MRYYASGIAAILVLAFVIYGVNQFMKRSGSVNVDGNIVEISGPKWMVTPVKGSPMINNMVMKAIDNLGIGGVITTNDSSKAELYVAGLGTVTIEPGSRIKLVKSTNDEHRIALEYGSIDASIIAKPRTFLLKRAMLRLLTLAVLTNSVLTRAATDCCMSVPEGLRLNQQAAGSQLFPKENSV